MGLDDATEAQRRAMRAQEDRLLALWSAETRKPKGKRLKPA
jgi:hypothetical protein